MYTYFDLNENVHFLHRLMNRKLQLTDPYFRFVNSNEDVITHTPLKSERAREKGGNRTPISVYFEDMNDTIWYTLLLKCSEHLPLFYGVTGLFIFHKRHL